MALHRTEGASGVPLLLTDLQGAPLDAIACAMPAADRLSLAHTCRTMWRCSRGWFSRVEACIGDDNGKGLDSRPLANYLRMHAAPNGTPMQVHLCILCAHVAPRVLEAVLRPLLQQQQPAAVIMAGLEVASTCSLSSNFNLAPLHSLTHLTSLKLSSVRLEGGGTEALGRLTGLRQLQLKHCGLEEVPQAISGLTALTLLHLDVNWGVDPASIDSVLPRLPALRQLSLAWCNLRQVPGSLQALPALTHLDLSHNLLERDSLAALELGPLAHLASLHLGGNDTCQLLMLGQAQEQEQGLGLVPVRPGSGSATAIGTHFLSPSSSSSADADADSDFDDELSFFSDDGPGDDEFASSPNSYAPITPCYAMHAAAAVAAPPVGPMLAALQALFQAAQCAR